MDSNSQPVSTGAAGLPAKIPAAGLLAERWPALAGAMSRYQHATAEAFTRAAYEAVEGGLIRHDRRRRLAELAEEYGIRAFDAQLLIACAVRQWAHDRRYDPKPSAAAPVLSFEYKAWRRAWARAAFFFAVAAMMDVVIIWKWLT